MTSELRVPRALPLSRPAAGNDLEDRMRPLTPAEKACRDSVYQRLLKVVDLSLMSSLPDKEARRQIREISERLLSEEQAPLNHASRQSVVKRIEDEVLGLGPWSHC